MGGRGSKASQKQRSRLGPVAPNVVVRSPGERKVSRAPGPSRLGKPAGNVTASTGRLGPVAPNVRVRGR